jgi:predicted metalloprotease
MDLDREPESRNIEDRRGRRVSRGVAGGGIGTILIILLALFFGFDPRMCCCRATCRRSTSHRLRRHNRNRPE